MEMPSGMLVLPIVSMEEYLNHYFQRTNLFGESCWFPAPRMGSRWEAFCALPVSTLATAAPGGPQFCIPLDPGQRTSTFGPYPEMVQLAKLRARKRSERPVDLQEGEGDAQRDLFDVNLRGGLDTTKMEVKRVEPAQIAENLRHRPPIPQVAQLELHLFVCRY